MYASIPAGNPLRKKASAFALLTCAEFFSQWNPSSIAAYIIFFYKFFYINVWEN